MKGIKFNQVDRIESVLQTPKATLHFSQVSSGPGKKFLITIRYALPAHTHSTHKCVCMCVCVRGGGCPQPRVAGAVFTGSNPVFVCVRACVHVCVCLCARGAGPIRSPSRPTQQPPVVLSAPGTRHWRARYPSCSNLFHHIVGRLALLHPLYRRTQLTPDQASHLDATIYGLVVLLNMMQGKGHQLDWNVPERGALAQRDALLCRAYRQEAVRVIGAKGGGAAHFAASLRVDR